MIAGRPSCTRTGPYPLCGGIVAVTEESTEAVALRGPRGPERAMAAEGLASYAVSGKHEESEDSGEHAGSHKEHQHAAKLLHVSVTVTHRPDTRASLAIT